MNILNDGRGSGEDKPGCHDMRGLTVLFSEGSSTSARQTLEALRGSRCRVVVCDPNPLCLCHFSDVVEKTIRCPHSGTNPTSYLTAVEQVIHDERVDVLLPNHEQAYLFSRVASRLAKEVKIAICDFEAMQTLYSKVRFLGLLERLGLCHPATKIYGEIKDIERLPSYPFYLKSEFGTASQGVFRITSALDFQSAVSSIRKAGVWGRFLVQEACRGSFENVYTLFDHGRLVACHSSVRTIEGFCGGHIVRTGVDRPTVEREIGLIGAELGWHGCVAFDYFYEDANKKACYIDASPRLVEPMNAHVNGTPIVNLQIGLSLDGTARARPTPSRKLSTYSVMMGLLATAFRSRSRMAVLREFSDWRAHRGHYRRGVEELTNPTADRASWVPIMWVLANLTARPFLAEKLGRASIRAYALSKESVETIDDMAT